MSSAGDQSFEQGAGGLLDTPEGSDCIGSSMAAGDFDGDGNYELVIGVSGDDISGASNAGAFHVLKGTSSGLLPDQFWH